MSFNNKKEEVEKFPENMNQLILKCEHTMLEINERFANKDCIMVKDLYIEKTDNRCKDFLEKLQVTCNSRLHKNVKSKNELQGLYVFGELNEDKIIPIYVGISRTIFRRLRQHVWGNIHNEATLAYLKAKKRLGHKKGRLDLLPDELKLEQEEIKNYHLIVIPESNDYDMYFMEVYLAGRLKTYWNSFRTH